MIDLVITHLNQPWGPSWTLATLKGPFPDHFPIEIPIKNKKCWYTIVYGSINFFVGLWPYHTYLQSAWVPQASKRNSTFR